MNAANLLQAQIETKRGEMHLRSALGAAIAPEAFCPDVAEALRVAMIASSRAVAIACLAVQAEEQKAHCSNVVRLAGARRKKRREITSGVM